MGKLEGDGWSRAVPCGAGCLDRCCGEPTELQLRKLLAQDSDRRMALAY